MFKETKTDYKIKKKSLSLNWGRLFLTLHRK